MPLEALRFPVTPVGLHYLLIHYDVPIVDAAEWRLSVHGERELSLGLEELRARPALELTATMECAGNGRARLEPHVVSQPWLLEAVGTGRWKGTPLRSLLEEAGMGNGAVEVLFTGLDRGVEGGEEQQFQRSLPLDAALGDEVLLAYELNGAPLPPQHGFPLRLLVPGWYGMTNVKWLDRIEILDRPFERLPAGAGLPAAAERGRGGRAAPADAAALARRPARDSGVPDPRAHRPGGRVPARGSRLVGPGACGARRGERRRRRRRGPKRSSTRRKAAGRGAAGASAGTRSPARTSSAHARATRRATSSRSSRPGTSAATRTTRCRRCASRSPERERRHRREGEHDCRHHDQTAVERPHRPFLLPLPPGTYGPPAERASLSRGV